jgi:ABC-type spermidine/putrescine transport system permease subunit I
MTKRSTWALPYAIFLVLFVALPLILIMFYAFRDGSGGFTFANFIKFFRDSDAIGTFALSLEVAIENTAICILLGYPAAWILADKKLNKSAVTIVLFIMPMWINALMRTLATAELFHMLGMSTGNRSAINVFKHKNVMMLIAFLAGFVLQLLVIEVGVVRSIFSTANLSSTEWLITALISVIPVVAHEIIVLVKRFTAKKSQSK